MLSCSSRGGEHEEDEERMMGLVAPSRNEWPLQRMMGERILMMPGANTPTSSNSSTGTTDNTAITPGAPTQAGGTHHQAPLKCPRCDSSNTKFCYYNNYSLSQPRHFCKACKRYWTRGGTLRNVPVGGGCRKNKRVKKTSSSTPHVSSSAPPPPLSLPPVTSQIDVPAIDLNPLFYDLSWQRMHHPISGCNVYDLQPQMNALGLGFNDEYNHDQAQFQPSSFLHEYPLFGSSSTLSSATAASLLVSSLKQPTNAEDYLGQYSMLHYANLEAAPGANLGVLKEVKVEGDGVNGMGGNWQLSCGINPFEAASTAPVPDSSFMYWNTAAAAWPDAANNCGSSIAPLI